MIFDFQRFFTEQSFCISQQIARDLLGNVKAARRLLRPPASSTPELQIISYWPRPVANELLRCLIGASMCTDLAVGVKHLWESSAFPQMLLDPLGAPRLFGKRKNFKNKATRAVGMWASLLVHMSTAAGVSGNLHSGQRACTLSTLKGVRAVYVGNVPARCPASCRWLNRWAGSAQRSLDLSLRHFRTHS